VNVGKPAGECKQGDEAALERKTAIRRVELGRERGDGTAVQIESTSRVSTCREQEQGPAAGSAALVLRYLDLLAREEGETDESDCQFLLLAVGQAPLEPTEPPLDGSLTHGPFGGSELCVSVRAASRLQRIVASMPPYYGGTP
jgi:hypothetical protein